MGPAPAVAAVRRAVRTLLAGVDGPVLVACSGGADSLALAAATAFVRSRDGRVAGLVTVDHGLQHGSHHHAARIADLGRSLGLDPVEVIRVEIGTAGGPEAAARDARYAALTEAAVARGASVLLGHTLDDQAETVLLGLGRGSGPRSIAGMVATDGRWLRPLLGLRRATTEAACAALGLDVWDDPHNADARFQRVRLRREVLPLLEDALQGGVAEALARTADLLRDDLDALDAWAAGVPIGAEPDVAALAALPRAVRTRVLRRWAAAAGAPTLSAERTAALDALITGWHGQGPLDLPGGVTVRRASGRLVAIPSTTPAGSHHAPKE
jgi:tRNA(Ile)-lysidine synthase